MFAVVGCSECQALWVVDTDVETTGCPRCGTRHRLEKLKQFVRTAEESEAREVRGSLLAKRQGEEGAFDEIEDFETLARRAEIDVVADAAYLAKSGIDPSAIEAAGERAMGGTESQDRRTIIEEAVRKIDEPTEDDVADRAQESGLTETEARETLRRLVRDGTATEQAGVYRLL
jgi:hypothetical protein